MQGLHCYFAADSSCFRDEEPSRKPFMYISSVLGFFFCSNYVDLHRLWLLAARWAWHYTKILSEAPAA
jgi:hypothetical protein